MGSSSSVFSSLLPVHRHIWFASLLLIWVNSCIALEGGIAPAKPTIKLPSSSVGSLSVDGRLFSAVVIGSQHVLTAAHIVAGADPKKIVFSTPLAGGIALTGQWIVVHPEFTGQTTGNVPGDPSSHADLAVIKLTEGLPATMRPLSVWDGSLLGRIITLISNGGSTSQITRGENRVDVIFPNRQGQPAIYVFDFDGPTLSSNSFGPAIPINGTLGEGREASLVKGDSGSAAFIWVNGQWQLAGINTFQLNIGLNRGAGGVVLSSYKRWIEQTLDAKPPATAVSPVPTQPTRAASSLSEIPFKP